MTPREILNKFINDVEFNRPDIAVRILYIEYYFNKNNFGKDLYLKMQKIRTGSEKNYIKKFNSLIESFKKEGILKGSKILISKNGCLLDGSHRLSCAIYFNRLDDLIDYRVDNYTVKYNLDWFKKNFTEKEYEIIKKKYDDISKIF